MQEGPVDRAFNAFVEVIRAIVREELDRRREKRSSPESFLDNIKVKGGRAE